MSSSQPERHRNVFKSQSARNAVSWKTARLTSEKGPSSRSANADRSPMPVSLLDMAEHLVKSSMTSQPAIAKSCAALHLRQRMHATEKLAYLLAC